jgi:uncharacterized membrane protein YfcA
VTAWQIVAVTAAGIGAGVVNSVVGSGTLLTFPLLLALGYSRPVANASNTIGVIPGAVVGAYGYREELTGHAGFVVRLAVSSVLGGALGAVLFLSLPPRAFNAVVPGLVALATVLVLVQPRLAARMAERDGERAKPGWRLSPGLFVSTFLVGVYGGYFGGGQGVLLLGVLGLFLGEALQKVNGVKNVLAATANAVAGVLFAFAPHVFHSAPHIAWEPALLIFFGSALGGQIGSRFGRKLHPNVLRGLIVVVGIVTVARLA